MAKLITRSALLIVSMVRVVAVKSTIYGAGCRTLGLIVVNRGGKKIEHKEREGTRHQH